MIDCDNTSVIQVSGNNCTAVNITYVLLHCLYLRESWRGVIQKRYMYDGYASDFVYLHHETEHVNFFFANDVF